MPAGGSSARGSLHASSSEQLTIFLDLMYAGQVDAPSMLRAQLQDPKLQETLSEMLERFTKIPALKDLRIGPWALAYRVTGDGRVIDYRRGRKVTEAQGMPA